VRYVRHTDVPAVQLDGPAGDRQAETGASVGAGQAAAIEALEHVPALVRRYARSFIGYLEDDGAAGGHGVGGDRDSAVCRAVGCGVVQQVRHDLVQAVAVAADAQCVSGIDDEPDRWMRALGLRDGRGEERNGGEDAAIKGIGTSVEP